MITLEFNTITKKSNQDASSFNLEQNKFKNNICQI